MIRQARRIIVLLAWAITLVASPPAPAAPVLGPGDFAPPIVAKDLEGRQHTVKWEENTYTVVNFWGTWCDPCPAAMQGLEGLFGEHAGDGVAVVGIVFGPSTDEEAAAFAADLGISYPILRATIELIRRWGNIQVMPASFLVDSDGKIVRRYVGGQEMTDGIIADVNSLLAGGPLTTLKPVPIIPPKH